MRIKNWILRHFYRNNFIQYAKNIGVNFPDGGTGIKLLSCNFGSEPWLVFIGNHVELSGNVTFITHDGSTWVFRNKDRYKSVIRYGAIHIKENCFIGQNALILPNITIGPNAIVGAGSVVTKDVMPGTVVAGNPAHVICTVEEFAEKCLKETPYYDKEEYRKDKKKEIFRAYNIAQK